MERLRPKLMTDVSLLLGLLPNMWSAGTGADVMKRIAAPMLGGIASVLGIVFPAIYALWKGNSVNDGLACRYSERSHWI